MWDESTAVASCYSNGWPYRPPQPTTRSTASQRRCRSIAHRRRACVEMTEARRVVSTVVVVVVRHGEGHNDDPFKRNSPATCKTRRNVDVKHACLHAIASQHHVLHHVLSGRRLLRYCRKSQRPFLPQWSASSLAYALQVEQGLS